MKTSVLFTSMGLRNIVQFKSKVEIFVPVTFFISRFCLLGLFILEKTTLPNSEFVWCSNLWKITHMWKVPGATLDILLDERFNHIRLTRPLKVFSFKCEIWFLASDMFFKLIKETNVLFGMSVIRLPLSIKLWRLISPLNELGIILLIWFWSRTNNMQPLNIMKTPLGTFVILLFFRKILFMWASERSVQFLVTKVSIWFPPSFMFGKVACENSWGSNNFNLFCCKLNTLRARRFFRWVDVNKLMLLQIRNILWSFVSETKASLSMFASLLFCNANILRDVRWKKR